jgi:hypothetical protein
MGAAGSQRSDPAQPARRVDQGRGIAAGRYGSNWRLALAGDDLVGAVQLVKLAFDALKKGIDSLLRVQRLRRAEIEVVVVDRDNPAGLRQRPGKNAVPVGLRPPVVAVDIDQIEPFPRDAKLGKRVARPRLDLGDAAREAKEIALEPSFRKGYSTRISGISSTR